jgi:hypothetical protein
VFPHLSSIDILFSSYPLKAKYVELMGKDKGYNSCHAYCQVKGWSKKSYEIFSNDFGKGFENGMMEGEKIDFPILFAETLGAFLFLPLFFIPFLSLSLFSMLRLFEDLGILMINEEKNSLQKFLFR